MPAAYHALLTSFTKQQWAALDHTWTPPSCVMKASRQGIPRDNKWDSYVLLSTTKKRGKMVWILTRAITEFIRPAQRGWGDQTLKCVPIVSQIQLPTYYVPLIPCLAMAGWQRQLNNCSSVRERCLSFSFKTSHWQVTTNLLGQFHIPMCCSDRAKATKLEGEKVRTT